MTVHALPPPGPPPQSSDLRDRLELEAKLHRLTQRLVQLQQEWTQRRRARVEQWPGERRHHERRRSQP